MVRGAQVVVMCATLAGCGRLSFDPVGDVLDGATADADTVAGTIAQEAYVKASNADAGDVLGWALAISADGSTLAVGAKGEQSSTTGVNPPTVDNAGTDAGAVYVFVRTETGWAQQAYIKASNTQNNDWFGAALAISGDGSTLAVAAIMEDSSSRTIDGNQFDNGASNSGAIYVFERAGVTWTQRAYLKASNADPQDLLGLSIAMSQDGNTIVAGSADDSDGTNPADNSFTNSGAAFVFVRSGGTWAEQAYLKAAVPDAGDDLGGGGAKVDISADGNTIVVGATGEDSDATGVNGDPQSTLSLDSGAAYIFVRSGTTWSQEAYLKASNTDSLDRFGNGVAISGDGATVAIGAAGEASGTGDPGDNSRAEAGAIHVFVRDDAGWIPQQYIKASNPDMGDHFGSAALSHDGSILLGCGRDEASSATGIDGDQTNNSIPGAGACYIFERAGGLWTQRHYVKASNSGSGDSFSGGGGDSIAISADGSTIAIGTVGEDSAGRGIGTSGADDGATDAGAVYVFR